MMAQKSRTPNMPRLEMVKVPPVIWSGDSLLSLACGAPGHRLSAAEARHASRAGQASAILQGPRHREEGPWTSDSQFPGLLAQTISWNSDGTSNRIETVIY